MNYINAISIHNHTSDSYAEHLRSIRNHYGRLKTKRANEAKLRKAEHSTKPPSKPYSIRFNAKGTLVLTIRKRKPPYLYRSEWLEIESEYKDHRELLQKILAKRNITIKPDPDKKS